MKWWLNVAVKKVKKALSRKVAKKFIASRTVVGGAKKIFKLALRASIGASLSLGQLLTIALIGQ
jgi:hypothetical protein